FPDRYASRTVDKKRTGAPCFSALSAPFQLPHKAVLILIALHDRIRPFSFPLIRIFQVADHPIASLPFPDLLYGNDLRLLPGQTSRPAHPPFQQAAGSRKLPDFLLRPACQGNICRKAAPDPYILSRFHHEQAVLIIQAENQSVPPGLLSQ